MVLCWTLGDDDDMKYYVFEYFNEQYDTSFAYVIASEIKYLQKHGGENWLEF